MTHGVIPFFVDTFNREIRVFGADVHSEKPYGWLRVAGKKGTQECGVGARVVGGGCLTLLMCRSLILA